MKVGILGGGQLGRMLLQVAPNYPVETYVMENDAACPAAHLCHHFILGDIRDFEAVYSFGKQVDALTIEIENVNIDALEQLEKEGVRIFPTTQALRIIKNKIRQKEFYRAHEIPTADFLTLEGKPHAEDHAHFFPAVHKLAEGGYDGKGVQLMHTGADAEKGFSQPGVLEKMVDLEKEIAIMVAIDAGGQTALYPPVEMVFDPYLNLLDYQIAPANLEEKSLWRAEAIALKFAKAIGSPGLFAIEMFVSKSGEVLVNETAPRVHNSGHHTIEAHYCSQYDMLWRILLGYPLGDTSPIQSSTLVNLVGEADYSGPAYYEGLEKILAMGNAYVHLYGKTSTKPGRKMGHVTIITNDRQDLVRKAHEVKRTIRVISK
jgi:5-(carboxyamino)imidazole ribonucleotide synthase